MSSSCLVRGVWPGLFLTFALAALAFAVRRLPGLGSFSPMIIAIVLGIAFHNLVGTPARAHAGIAFSLRRFLRLAIVLLGLQLTFLQVIEVGGRGLVVIVVSLVATFLFTTWAGNVMGVDRKLSQLIASGTSICGASAVIATNIVTHADEEDVAYAVACVTVFGSIAMVVYPLFPAVLGLEPRIYGLWAGASIHEIAQVVAAAFQDGQQAGEVGTVAKLSRVVLLAPMVLAIGLVSSLRAAEPKPHGETATLGRIPIPWFVLGFIALIGVNSVVTVPPDARAWLATLTTFLLTVALAGMGLVTDLRKLTARGHRPMLLGLLASLFIAGLSFVLIKLLG